MADFVQTMKDWRRLCATRSKLHDDPCEGCPLEDFGCSPIYEDEADTDYSVVGRKVSAWAAEHPEPKYPTWIEWLEEIGVAGRLPSVEPVFTENQEFYLRTLGFTPKAYDPIPTDTAEKLEIKPKGEV